MKSCLWFVEVWLFYITWLRGHLSLIHITDAVKVWATSTHWSTCHPQRSRKLPWLVCGCISHWDVLLRRPFCLRKSPRRHCSCLVHDGGSLTSCSSGSMKGQKRLTKVEKVSPKVLGGHCHLVTLKKVKGPQSMYSEWKVCFPSACSVQCLANTYSSSQTESSSPHLFFLASSLFPSLIHHPLPFPFSGAAVSVHLTEEWGAGWQGSGCWRLRRGWGGGSGGGEEGGVGAHLVYVDIRGVEQDVVLAAEAGEDGRDAGNQLREWGPSFRLWVPTLDHDRVAKNREERN